MQIDFTADEIARLCRLLHLANDPADAALWEKLKTVHVANQEWAEKVASLTARIEVAADVATFNTLEHEYSRLLQQALHVAPSGVPFHDEPLDAAGTALRAAYRRLTNHEAPKHCGQGWVAEIALCYRCGLSAAEHPASPLADQLTGRVIELSPVQTSVPGLTDVQTQDAYAAIKDRFNLRAGQRSRLDRATQYAAALTAAHAGDWKRVERLLGYASVIS